MPYQINTTHTFILDGSETNAGQRAFVRDARAFALDGAEFGSAANRMFLKDLRAFVMSGQGDNATSARGMATSMFALSGPPRNAIHANMITFSFDGRPWQHNIVTGRVSGSFIIENAAQETPPT